MKKSWLMGLLSIICLGWVLGLSTAWADEEKITVRDFTFYPGDKPGVLSANIHFDYELSDYLRESLLNGGTLQHDIRFDLVWHSEWWFNKVEVLSTIHSELKYHALSNHYQVLRNNGKPKVNGKESKESWNFPNLAAALAHLGMVERYRLPDLPAAAYQQDAALYVQASLAPKEPDNLPLGLSALFAKDHRLVSQGVLWALTP